MRMVEEYRDTHNQEEIFVIGSSFSLNDFPEMFFKGRITIAMNYTGLAFPKCPDFPTYSLHIHDEPLKYILKHKPDFLKKCILAWLPPNRTKRLTWPEDYNHDPTWIRWHAWELKKEDIQKMVAQMMDKETRKDCVHLSYYTTLHVAIEVAVIMGAKSISLVGADHKANGERHHTTRIKGFNGQPLYSELRNAYSSKEREKHDKIILCHRKGTLWLTQALKPYEIQVRRFYYPDRYEGIE